MSKGRGAFRLKSRLVEVVRLKAGDKVGCSCADCPSPALHRVSEKVGKELEHRWDFCKKHFEEYCEPVEQRGREFWVRNARYATDCLIISPELPPVTRVCIPEFEGVCTAEFEKVLDRPLKRTKTGKVKPQRVEITGRVLKGG